MRTIGLIVEGSYDEAALQELVKRCSKVPTTVISRTCGGKSRMLKRFPGFLQEFLHIKEGASVDKALVVFDADNKDPQAEIKRFANTITNRNYPFPIKYCVIVQELEAWLLASKVAAPETLFDPKTTLEAKLNESKISYTPEVARSLASNVNLDTLRNRCKSFNPFPQIVINGQGPHTQPTHTQ